MVMCSNDARFCCDRIVYAAEFLALRRLGIPKPMIVRMFHTIQKMYHNIHTSYGDSTSTYRESEWQLPSHDSVQGNGTSPLTWATVSTIIFLALK